MSHEQAPEVDETKFNQMEAVAVAAGPQAEARRQEMDAWSKATGAYAETAADRAADRNQSIALSGILVDGYRHGKQTVDIANKPERPNAPTMVGLRGNSVVTGGINGEGIVNTYRSPAQITADSKK